MADIHRDRTANDAKPGMDEAKRRALFPYEEQARRAAGPVHPYRVPKEPQPPPDPRAERLPPEDPRASRSYDSPSVEDDTASVEGLSERAIRRLQIALIIKGYDPGDVNGSMTDPTVGALKSYQGEHDLARTGRPDAPTLASLGVTR